MDILNHLYQTILVQPIFNGLVGLYATVGQQQSGLTLSLVSLLTSLLLLPTMIKGYYDQERTKDLHQAIETINQTETNSEKKQQQILSLLKTNQISFQSESIFLFGLVVVAFLLYPVLLNHWNQLDLTWLYHSTPRPIKLDPSFLSISVNHSSPTLSLLPAILLFFELRQSYREQRFLTGFLDKWYPVILPLFVYFLIFWLPSGIALVLTVCLAISLYVRALLNIFTAIKRQRRAT